MSGGIPRPYGGHLDAKTLGILELENETLKHHGALSAPGTFTFPVRRLTVPGAFVQSMVAGDRINSAQRLEAGGVSAVIANCGFSILLQREVAAAVSIPVALSTLLLVPFVAAVLPRGRKVGSLPYDAEKLTQEHFEAAGWSSLNRPGFAGGSNS